MTRKDTVKTFINQMYIEPPGKIYRTNKTIYNHVDEIWSLDLADMADHKVSNKSGFRYINLLIDDFPILLGVYH